MLHFYLVLFESLKNDFPILISIVPLKPNLLTTITPINSVFKKEKLTLSTSQII